MDAAYDLKLSSDVGLSTSSQPTSSINSGIEQASLLSLPLEIRLQIYKYLFRVDSTIPFCDGVRTCEWKPFPGLGLIRSCKKLHAELEDLIYIKNTLRFHVTFVTFDQYFNTGISLTGFRGPEIRNLIIDPDGPKLLKQEKQLSKLLVGRNLLSPLNADAVKRLRSIAMKIELADWQFEVGFQSIRRAFRALVTVVADQEGKPYNLRSLSITLPIYQSYPPLPEPKDKAWANFIEPLAELHGLESVDIKGPVRSPFKERLIWAMTRKEKVHLVLLKTVSGGIRARIERNEQVGPNGWVPGRIQVRPRTEPNFGLELDWSGVAELMEAEHENQVADEMMSDA